MRKPRYPSLYQINTRVWLTELSRQQGRPATLDDIPDAELDRLAELGFDWIWFLSVWQTGRGAQQVSRNNPEWRREFQETLPDLCEDDIAGSGFAITGYTVHQNLGGDAAAAHRSESMKRCSSSTSACLRSFVSRSCAMANGNCWNALRAGREMGRTIASWSSPGKGRSCIR
jgi:hypothetical protein